MKEAVRELLRVKQEVFMPLMHPVEYAHMDFGYALAKVSKVSKDGHVLERAYTIRFDTFLGYFFVQNCVSCYIDLLPGKFYSISDYAQLFYRILILPYYEGVKNPVGIKEIKNRLALKTRDTYMVRKVVKRILDELESNSLISQPKEEKVHGRYLYSYRKNTWKEVQ